MYKYTVYTCSVIIIFDGYCAAAVVILYHNDCTHPKNNVYNINLW